MSLKSRQSLSRQGRLCALFIGLIVSCQKESPVKEEQQAAVEFKAEIDDETKTYLDGKQVKWKQGDQVTIFNGTKDKQKFQVKDSDDGQTTATLSKVSGSTSGASIDYIVAYYPYDTYAGVAKDPLTEVHYINNITVPNSQTYSEGSFANDSFPMVAMKPVGASSLSFEYVFGVLRFQLKGTAKIKKIELTGNNDEYLCGTMTLQVQSGPYIQSCSVSGGKKITLNCGAEGVQLSSSSATAFNITLPPMTMSKGFTAIITDTEDGTMELSTSKPQTIAKGGVLKMPEKTYSPAVALTAVDLGLSVKWANLNLGASKPEDAGGFYAWGETATKTNYAWSTYSWGTSDSNITKYNSSDGKTVLEMADDAARQVLGDSWRIPTYAECEELMNSSNCSWTWTEMNGTGGYKVQSLKAGYTDNWIFLPLTGFYMDSSCYSKHWGHYWCSKRRDYAANAYFFEFKQEDHTIQWYSSGYNRCYGLAIRAVK